MSDITPDRARAVLELQVHNHPGVMSHVCGLLARRAFNIEGIICLPERDKHLSRIWLVILESERLPQVIKQLSKLHDVLAVQQHGVEDRIFAELETLFEEAASTH